MKKFIPLSAMVFAITLLSGCSVIEGIFKAGFWSGMIVVILVLAVIIWIIAKLLGGGNKN